MHASSISKSKFKYLFFKWKFKRNNFHNDNLMTVSLPCVYVYPMYAFWSVAEHCKYTEI